MASQTGRAPPAAVAGISGQRKRGLEALERRFAAEAYLRQERERADAPTPNKKPTAPLPKDAPRKREDAKVLESVKYSASRLSVSAKKDSNNFPTPTPRRGTSKSSDVEVHPIYSEISELIIDENLLPAEGSEVANRRDAVSKIVNNIVQKGEEGSKFAKGGRRLKIDNWILLDNYVAKDNSLMEARLKAIRSHSKRSQKHMSRRQHKKIGTFGLPKEYHNFDLFEPMHQIWKEYILELLKDHGRKKLADTLLIADLHGAFIMVADCKDVSFKGLSGLMIRETAETFGIISRDNCFRVVPKVGSVFRFQAGCWKITLYGDKVSERMLNQKDTRQKK